MNISLVAANQKMGLLEMEMKFRGVPKESKNFSKK